MRLDRKLKALRDTQAGFAEAVRTLDQAAARAENGLDTLRRTAEDTHDSLHDRIMKARELKAELETLVSRAERAAADLDKPRPSTVQATLPERASSPRLELGAPAGKNRVVFTTPRDEEAPLELTQPIGPGPQTRAPRPHIPPPMKPLPSVSPSRRSAARNLDEDLFDTAPAGEGRRRIFGVRS
jgi:hypothetical protein